MEKLTAIECTVIDNWAECEKHYAPGTLAGRAGWLLHEDEISCAVLIPAYDSRPAAVWELPRSLVVVVPTGWDVE